MSPTLAYLLALVWSAVPFVPAEPMLVTMGSWAASGGPHPLLLVAAAAAGSFVSDLVKYWLGLLFGPAVLRKLERRPSGARATAWVRARMARSGPGVIVPSYFVPFGVVAATLLSGAIRLPLRGVAVASLVGAAVWAGVYVALGYVGGAVTGNPLVGVALGMAAALAIALLSGTRRRREAVSSGTSGPASAGTVPAGPGRGSRARGQAAP